MSKGYVGISAESDQNRYIERTLVPPDFDTTTAVGGDDGPSWLPSKSKNFRPPTEQPKAAG
jgi:hypothetical protein